MNILYIKKDVFSEVLKGKTYPNPVNDVFDHVQGFLSRVIFESIIFVEVDPNDVCRGRDYLEKLGLKLKGVPFAFYTEERVDLPLFKLKHLSAPLTLVLEGTLTSKPYEPTQLFNMADYTANVIWTRILGRYPQRKHRFINITRDGYERMFEND